LNAPAEAQHRFDPPWIKAGRVYRRVCLLRLEGRDDDARHVMEGEFAQAEAAALASCRGEADGESHLRAFLDGEGERMAMAVALAEVLVPELSRRLFLQSAAPVRASQAPEPSLAGSRSAAPALADFIDEMLALERTAAS
jgi:hypothetical protein